MNEPKTARFNAEVLAIMAREAVTGEDAVDQPGDAFIMGFVSGIALTEAAPLTAKGIRQAIEVIVARKVGAPPEQAESALRTLVASFDRSADEVAS